MIDAVPKEVFGTRVGVMDGISPAKVNLFLKVVSKRPDGYHNLVSIVDIVSIYDVIRLRSPDGEVRYGIRPVCSRQARTTRSTGRSCSSRSAFAGHPA